MDKLYKYGLTKLFLIIALEVVKKRGDVSDFGLI